jgi:6-phosphogluconolactonase
MKGRFKFWSVVAVGLALLPSSLPAEFVYVANFVSNNVSAYRIGTSGALTPIAGSPFPAGSFPHAVAVGHSGRFVYVANSGRNPDFSGSVSAYRIGVHGALTPVAGSPFPAGSFSTSVAVGLSDRFVYVANEFSNNVSAYRVGANGVLTPVAGSPFPAGSSVAVGLFGRFVYVANSGSNPAFNGSVSAYRIGVDGALTPVAGSPFLAGIEPDSVAVDLLGRFVCVANDGKFPASNGSVSAYRTGANGFLTPVPGSPFTAGFTARSQPSSVAMDPLGRFVYVANYGASLVSVYRIGANGALTPVAGSPFPTGTGPICVAVDRLGRFVYVANSSSNTVSAYRIVANGTLTAVAGSPFPTGDVPVSVAVSPEF